MTPLMTVGLPVYNSMPYLPETMDSLFSQSFRDFEILAVVDDCKDGSVEYMESLRDPRLRILRQPKGGLVPALNLMLREASTPWLVRQDTDDIAYPNRLERMARAIQEHPDAGMFYSLAEYYPKEKSLGLFRCTRGTPDELRAIAESGLLLSFCHPSVVLNRAKTLEIGGYDASLHVEDVDLWCRMALHYPIHFVPEVLLGYRHNASSLTANNLHRAQLELLYDQYLLLSRLNHWTPLPFSAVRDLLEPLVSKRDLEAKEHLRNVNMMMAKSAYVRACFYALRSLLASPSYFLSRLRDEFASSRPITNGVDPGFFLNRKEQFWQA